MNSFDLRDFSLFFLISYFQYIFLTIRGTRKDYSALLKTKILGPYSLGNLNESRGIATLCPRHPTAALPACSNSGAIGHELVSLPHFPHFLICIVSMRVGHELLAGRPERARLVAHDGLCCGAALGLLACALAASVSGTQDISG